MDDASNRRAALWLLGAVLVFAALRVTLSYDGYWLTAAALDRLGAPLGIIPGWLFAALLGAGIVLVAALCFLAVGRFGAPRQLWLSSLTVSVLQLAGDARLVGLAGLAGSGTESASRQFEIVLYGQPFMSARLHVVAAVGYPLAAWLGCWLGHRFGTAQARSRERVNTRLTRAST